MPLNPEAARDREKMLTQNRADCTADVEAARSKGSAERKKAQDELDKAHRALEKHNELYDHNGNPRAPKRR